MTNQLYAALPEEHVRFTQLPNDAGHNAVWDFVRSPEGRFFVSVCGENEKPLTAILYEYLPDSGELRRMFDVADVWIIDKEAMPPSKIHTSIDFLPDGRLIMATHNTAPAPGHRQWMFEQHYEHPWEGYPGSILMIVDPDSNDVQVKGIPVPRESMYGGMLGDDPRYYYFLGYMKGHFYRIDLETNEVKDYGKVSEFSSCRLVKDSRGRMYGSSYTGEIWQYDPASDTIQDVKVSFQSPHGTKHRRQFIFALHTPRNTLLMVDNMDGEIIELNTDTLEAIRHGHIHLPEQVPVNPYGIGGLAADENFIIYYGLKTYDEYCPIRLVRWDILNGGKPENLGLVSPGGKDSQYLCEMIFDDRGVLHMVDVCGEHSPYILAVDVKRLEPPAEDAVPCRLNPYTEPDYNGVGQAAYMHIDALRVVTLPLHMHMDWKDSAVCHIAADGQQLYTIGGGDGIYLTTAPLGAGQPASIRLLHDGSGPLSCLSLPDGGTAALSASGELLLIDLASGSCRLVFSSTGDTVLTRLVCASGASELLAADDEGRLYAVDLASSIASLLDEQLRLPVSEAFVLPLRGGSLLLSGRDDELLVYDRRTKSMQRLSLRTPSIRGRAFKATLTGAAQLNDGTIVAGTLDGMLFTLASDLKRATRYGRLYSSGELRGFIARGGDEVFGIYGGERDAGHVFYFSIERGFVDLGRPRVVKDNAELSGMDTEWASIHYISSIACSPDGNWLGVASGERQYGAVVGYEGLRLP
ncbi:hypothetical protein M6D81_23095 [Paenibacillus sp. J5C_2022]|uniref:hypothetical protein n=1 Tax=Paenibacillus sp. J5C2022 TaxID=2977129 RepID=UPI0021CF9729|nr:hypothetical protein [Paenibacillus sp. J5C2022]MCU6711588.1 hypothetical protein [Paenibacillus sp. J5C2022]